MKCQKLISLLTEYYDETLNQKISSEVKEHLGQCEECKAKYGEFKNALKILKRLKPLD